MSNTGTLPSNFSPPRPGVDARDDLRAVLDHLLRVERAGAAGDALHEQPRVLADEDAHLLTSHRDRATTFCAPSAMVLAAWMARPLSFEDLASELDVRALEPDDERHLQPELLRRRDDAVGDDVALHDAAEDVDEDRLHLRALEDHLEGLGDLLLVGAAADVEEVRRRDAVAGAEVLDDVHRRHREAGAVDEAADVAVERHVVEARGLRLELDRVLLVRVLEVLPLGVAELGVVVEVDLRVERDDVAALGDDERVDLAERAVLLDDAPRRGRA